MTLLRDYKMYTFRVTYPYTWTLRNDCNDVIESEERIADFEEKAIAKSAGIAKETIMRNGYSDQQKNYKIELVKEEDAPAISITLPY